MSVGLNLATVCVTIVRSSNSTPGGATCYLVSSRIMKNIDPLYTARSTYGTWYRKAFKAPKTTQYHILVLITTTKRLKLATPAHGLASVIINVS